MQEPHLSGFQDGHQLPSYFMGLHAATMCYYNTLLRAFYCQIRARVNLNIIKLYKYISIEEKKNKKEYPSHGRSLISPLHPFGLPDSAYGSDTCQWQDATPGVTGSEWCVNLLRLPGRFEWKDHGQFPCYFVVG